MTVTFSPEVERRVLAAAAQRGLEPDDYLLSLVERDWELSLSPEPVRNGKDDTDPEALDRMIAKLTSRTPEQKQAARERAIQESRPLIELPPDVSVFDVMPVIRGEETDEEVIAALRELS